MTGLPFQGHHQRREAEWVGALVCLGVAIALLMPGPTFSRPTFGSFGAVAPEGTWGMALLAIALIRMLGLWVNGSKRHSPSLRFVTATAGAVLWGWVTWLLWNDGYPGVNTGCGAYGMLCLVDTYCAVRAVWDQGRNDARRHRPEGRPLIDWLVTITALPADALKAIGTVAVGGLLAGGTYVLARIKEARRPAVEESRQPRIALDPADRDLGYTLVRTSTDLTRALNDHGDILRRALRDHDDHGVPPPRPPRPRAGRRMLP